MAYADTYHEVKLARYERQQAEDDAFENAWDEEIDRILAGESNVLGMPDYDELIDMMYRDPTGEEHVDDAIKAIFFGVGDPKKLHDSGTDRMRELLEKDKECRAAFKHHLEDLERTGDE